MHILPSWFSFEILGHGAVAYSPESVLVAMQKLNGSYDATAILRLARPFIITFIMNVCMTEELNCHDSLSYTFKGASIQGIAKYYTILARWSGANLPLINSKSVSIWFLIVHLNIDTMFDGIVFDGRNINIESSTLRPPPKTSSASWPKQIVFDMLQFLV